MSEIEQQQQKPKKKRPSSSSSAGAPIDESSNPVFSLPRDTQVNLLSEALLREFMHKRKFLQTLKQFDVENPRNEMTITSRAMMQELMTMQKVMAEMKSRGIDSIVEAVCEHRIEKKVHVQETRALKKELEELEAVMKELQEEKKKVVAAATVADENVTSSSVPSPKESEADKKKLKQLQDQLRALDNEEHELQRDIANIDTTGTKKKKNKDKDKKNKKNKDSKKKKKSSSSKDRDDIDNDDEEPPAITSIDDLLEDKEEHVLAAKKAEHIMHLRQQEEEEAHKQRHILDDLTKNKKKKNKKIKKDKDGSDSDSASDDDSDDSDDEEEDDENVSQKNDNDDDDKESNSRPPTAAAKHQQIQGIPQLKTSTGYRNKNKKLNNDDGELSVQSDDNYNNTSLSDSYNSSDQNNDDDNLSNNEDEEDDYEAGLRKIREEAMKETKLTRKNSLSTDGSLPRRRSWNEVGHNNHLGNNNNNDSQERSSSHGSSVSPGGISNSNHPNSFNNDNNNNFGDSSSLSTSTTTHHQQVDFRDDQVGTNLATSLVALMVGKHKRIPSSFFQPIVFSRVQSHPYGLVQRMGGPCGAIAALQARILSKWFFDGQEQENNSEAATNKRKKVLKVLNAALTSIFEDILAVRNAPDEPAVYIIPPPSKDTPYDTLQKQVSALSHCVLLEEANPSRVYPSELLTEAWTTSPWGLVCFILSCVLTRSRGQGTSPSETIISHMDEPRALIVEHGYCSQEMVNLMLCGWATSHLHDGVTHVDAGGGVGDNSGVALRGLYHIRPGQPLENGILSMMEVRKFFEVGSLGKNPKNPVWIIYNESHFTVLFAKDNSSFDSDSSSITSSDTSLDQQQKEKESFDLFYYDPQCEEDEYRLTITPSKIPLPATRANALISYVDQIIRTREGWKNARVSWNGADPLL